VSDAREPNRRDFLSGRAVARSAQAAAESVADALAGDAPRRPPAYLLHVGRSAMACEFEIVLNAGEYPEGPEVALRALDTVEQLEAQLTVYRDSSEASQLNALAASEPAVVAENLFALLSQAVQLGADTAGAFDITAGPLSKVWGFYRRAGRVPGEEELRAALERVGHRYLELDPQQRSVRFLREGVEINLGAIGKGYALDCCAALLTAAGIGDFLLHGGTSSILARGSRAGGREGDRGWTVALRHPFRPEQRLAEFRLRDRALGTSGSAAQHFFHQGKRYGHILDPRTGQPADAVVSATVLAPTAALADALSTAFYVLGAEGAAHYCATHPEVSAWLVLPDSRAGAARCVRLNWRAEDEDQGAGEGDDEGQGLDEGEKNSPAAEPRGTQ